MSLSNMPEVNSIGGFGGFGVPGASFGGGFGGGGLIEGLILASLLGRRGGGLFGGEGGESASLDADGIAAKVVALQNSSNILAAIQDAKDAGTLGTLAVSDAVKDGNYAAAIQAERNTAELSTQATAFAVAASRQADQNAQLILARLNQNEIDGLRDQLNGERRRADAREVEINITNSANATAQQFQTQAQAQMVRDFDLSRKLDIFNDQVNSTKQGIINLGTMLASGNQTSTSTNIK